MSLIKVRIGDERLVVTVSSRDYVKAKTKQLREFGYNSLRESEVREQLTKLLAGEELDVIGEFMRDEVVTGETP